MRPFATAVLVLVAAAATSTIAQSPSDAVVEVMQEDWRWVNNPKAWHQQAARTVNHRFTTFADFAAFALDAKKAGVSVLMVMKVQKTASCPGPWYAGLQMCDHINGSYPAADGTLELWQALLKEIRPMRLMWWWNPVYWSVQGEVWAAAAADRTSDVGKFFSWSASELDRCDGFNPCASPATCVATNTTCVGVGCAQGSWGSLGAFKGVKSAISSFGSPEYASYLSDAMANSWAKSLGFDGFCTDCGGDYHPSGSHCPHGMLQTEGGQSLPAFAKIIDRVRTEQPQIVMSGENYGSWAEVIQSHADVGGQGFPQYHTTLQRAVFNGNASDIESTAAMSGADAATMLCYLHEYYDGDVPGGCPSMYFRDQTATIMNVSQHEMFVALEAGSGVMPQHDGQPNTPTPWCPYCSPGWGGVTNDPHRADLDGESRLWAFTKYRALNRVALRTKLNISHSSSTGGALVYLKHDSAGPRGDAALLLYNPGAAQKISVDLRLLPSSVYGTVPYDLFSKQDFLLQTGAPPLAESWEVEMAAGEFKAYAGFSLGVFPPHKGKKAACQADDRYSRPAVGDTLQACFLECLQDVKCKNVYIDYVDMTDHLCVRAAPVNCTLMGAIEDPSAGCKAGTGTLVGKLPEGRPGAETWVGESPPLRKPQTTPRLKTTDVGDTRSAGPVTPTGVNVSWVFKDSATLRYCHQGFVELVHGAKGEPHLLTAWQAGRTGAEGTGEQWLFKAEANGVLPSSSPLVWSPAAAGPHHMVAGDGVRPAWSPTLFEDPQEPGRVWLIYDEGAARNGSVQHTGGSVYAKLSTDGGGSFGPPRLILGYDAWGGVDKVTIDQVRVTSDGKQWLLAFNSQCEGIAAATRAEKQGSSHSPHGGGGGGGSGAPLCATGVLMSDNRGENWTMLEGIIADVANITDYQEATLELCSPTQWLMLFRTKTGFIYKTRSTNGGKSWGASVPTNLLNPHSRVNLLARRDSGNSDSNQLGEFRELLLAYNPSKTLRQPLDLARSNTCGETWEHVKTLYTGHGSYPTMVQVGDNLVTTFTRDGKGVGIGAAVTRLPPPMMSPRSWNASSRLKSDDDVSSRRTEPLVPHLGFMTFFSARPELMKGWITHGVDFYCDENNLPLCDKSDTTFGSEINLTLAMWRRYGIPSLYPSLASVDGLMVRGIGLRQGWEDILERVVKAEILPNFGLDKALRGVFIGDEVCCGATAAKCWAEGYAPLAAKLREMLGPSAIIYANECLDIAVPELNVTEVPPDFDLISIDHYDGYLPGTNGSAEVEEAKANYEVLFGKMHPWQRAVLLPGTFACSNLSWADSVGMPLRVQQANVVEKLRGYWAWAQNDSRIGGFCPWHFNTRFGNPQYPGVCDMVLGAVEMPQVVAELRMIGETILHNANADANATTTTTTTTTTMTP